MSVPTAVLQQGTPTPGGFNNASASINGGFADMSGLMPVLLIGLYIIGALLAAQFVAPWLARSSLLGTVGDAILSAIGYAIKGSAAVAVLAVAALPAYLVLTVDASTRGVALRWVAYGVAAFAGLVAVGWLADRAVARYIKAHPNVDSWAELWESDDSGDAEVVADGGER